MSLSAAGLLTGRIGLSLEPLATPVQVNGAAEATAAQGVSELSPAGLSISGRSLLPAAAIVSQLALHPLHLSSYVTALCQTREGHKTRDESKKRKE